MGSLLLVDIPKGDMTYHPVITITNAGNQYVNGISHNSNGNALRSVGDSVLVHGHRSITHGHRNGRPSGKA